MRLKLNYLEVFGSRIVLRCNGIETKWFKELELSKEKCFCHPERQNDIIKQIDQI